MRNIEETIVEQAIALFQKHGYHETTINQICAACHITKGTFYYHFDSKHAIIFKYYEFLFQNLVNQMPELVLIKDPKEKLWKLYEYSVEHTKMLTAPLLNVLMIADAENGLTYFSPLNGGSVTDAHRMQQDLVRQLILQCQEEGSIRKEATPEQLMATFNSAIIGISLDWSSTNGKYDHKEWIRQMFQIIFA